MSGGLFCVTSFFTLRRNRQHSTPMPPSRQAEGSGTPVTVRLQLSNVEVKPGDRSATKSVHDPLASWLLNTESGAVLGSVSSTCDGSVARPSGWNTPLASPLAGNDV